MREKNGFLKEICRSGKAAAPTYKCAYSNETYSVSSSNLSDIQIDEICPNDTLGYQVGQDTRLHFIFLMIAYFILSRFVDFGFFIRPSS